MDRPFYTGEIVAFDYRIFESPPEAMELVKNVTDEQGRRIEVNQRYYTHPIKIYARRLRLFYDEE